MANEKNLISNNKRTPSERRENARKAGIASGKARRERKTVQKILSEYLNDDIKNYTTLAKTAKMVGISNEKSIKELVTAVCIINTLEKGDVSSLEKLSHVLGEDKQDSNKDVIAKLDKVLGDIDAIANE